MRVAAGTHVCRAALSRHEEKLTIPLARIYGKFKESENGREPSASSIQMHLTPYFEQLNMHDTYCDGICQQLCADKC